MRSVIKKKIKIGATVRQPGDVVDLDPAYRAALIKSGHVEGAIPKTVEMVKKENDSETK